MRKIGIFMTAVLATVITGGCRSGKKVCESVVVSDSATVEELKVRTIQMRERDTTSWLRDVEIDSIVFLPDTRDSMQPMRIRFYGLRASSRRLGGRSVVVVKTDSTSLRESYGSKVDTIKRIDELPAASGNRWKWRVVLWVVSVAVVWCFIRRFVGYAGEKP